MSMPAKLADWLEERTRWRTAARGWMDHPVVGGAPWAAALGAAVLACVGVLAFTGVVLMTGYAPSPQSAWASVHYIEFVQSRGWIVRGLHVWAAQALLVLAALHVVHGAFVATYRRPREVAWWVTLAVLGLAIGEAITGGLLPWDDRGWWARVVEGNIIGLAPGIGGWLQRMMQGGSELGALGLTRLYTLHVALLPLLLLGALWLRRSVVHRHGWVEGGSSVAYRVAFARAVLVGLLLVVAVFSITGATHGASLEAPADPMGDYPARPEWFLMSLYELRHFFHGSGEFFGTTMVPAAAGVYFALLPWIDRPGRPRAAVVHAPVAVVFAAAVGLAVVAVRKDARDEVYTKQRAKADRRADAAIRLAMDGVPPEGALAMVRNDPELRGRDLFEQKCSGCHVLGDLGDPKKATAAKLDGWGTAKWISAMIHDPDAPEFFGRGPYKGDMPSVDVRPKDKPPTESWSPMIKEESDRQAVADFLASLGDEPGDPPRTMDEATRAKAEKVVADRCTNCHMYKGDGDVNDSDEAPDLTAYGSIAWTRTQVADPGSESAYRKGAHDPDKKKQMPRFDKDLSAADVELVARWTRAHGRGQTLP